MSEHEMKMVATKAGVVWISSRCAPSTTVTQVAVATGGDCPATVCVYFDGHGGPMIGPEDAREWAQALIDAAAMAEAETKAAELPPLERIVAMDAPDGSS